MLDVWPVRTLASRSPWLCLGRSTVAVARLRDKARGGGIRTRHIDLQEHLHPSQTSIQLHLLHRLWTIYRTAMIRTHLRQLRHRFNNERPALRVSNMKMEAIELVVRHCVDSPQDIRNGVVRAGDVEVEATVGELGAILDVDWCERRVCGILDLGMGEEELRECCETVGEAEGGGGCDGCPAVG